MLKSASLAAVAVSLFLALQPCLAQRNLAVAVPPATEQRVALVIGNAAYAEAPLRNPANDAGDVAAALRELGFQVALKTNSSQRDMKQAIREFGDSLSRGGVGLFYFAGHGVQSRGRNFLVPVGARIEREADVEDETVDASFVLAQMEEARNRVNIVILDACRNNPYSRAFRSASRGLAQMDATSGTLIAFATAPGSVAADGDERNGVYTKHLLRQLPAAGVPVELMLKRVRDGVMTETKDRQVPWESSSLRGADFYFRQAAAQPAVPASPPPRSVAASASLLRLAKAQVSRGNQLVLQGKERDADTEYQPAFELLQQFRVDDLDDEAKVALGRLHARIGRDYYAALTTLRPLAEKGDPWAQNTVGHLYRDGRGTAKDEREAARWLRKAADQGSPFAQASLGVLYENGRGVDQDPAEAVRLYRKAADQGYHWGQNNLGVMYREGRGVAKDPREAALWLRKAAEQGNANAQNSLGVLYRDGQGLARDDREAVAWLRKSAEQKNARAQTNLGFMYEKGRGIPKDEREAVLWHQKAAAQENPVAQNNLGVAYEHGRGVSKDRAEAQRWYAKAAAQGDQRAKDNLARLKAR